jgi:hypothetical protein
MRLHELKDVVSRQVGEPDELVSLLELSVEDILDRFTDKLLEHKEKFGVMDGDDTA